MAKLTKEDFISSLKEMNLLEIKELVDAMKEEFGVDPSAVAVAAPVAGAAADATLLIAMVLLKKIFQLLKLMKLKLSLKKLVQL